MKRTLSLAALVVLVLVLGCFAFTQNFAEDHFRGPQTTLTGFTGEVWYTAVPQRGDITCLRGAPASTSLMPPWCQPGTKTRVRDRMLTGVLTTSEPRVTGITSVVMNMNLESSSYTGPIWGTFKWEIAGRGTWEGIWTGESNGMTSSVYKYVGHGTGEFHGLTIEVHAIWVAAKGERISGHILDNDRD